MRSETKSKRDFIFTPSISKKYDFSQSPFESIERILGEERTVVTTTIDINRTAETIMVGFYQSILDANMALISAQIQYNKNGGPNR